MSYREDARPGPEPYSIDDIADIVVVLDPSGRTRYINSAGERLLGRDLAAMGDASVEIIHPDDRSGVRAEVNRLVKERGGRRSFEFRAADASGVWHQFHTFGTNRSDDARINGIVLHSHDVTERQFAEDRLSFERLHDRLTGLPSRVLLTEFLERSLHRSANGGGALAVFALNIDGLGRVNASHGLRAGDELIMRIARDLVALVREHDVGKGTSSVVGRPEDGFFFLCENLGDARDAAVFAERIASTVRNGTVPEGQTAVTTSIGVAISGPSSDAQSLLINASSALAEAKNRGEAAIEFFDEAVRLDAESRIRRVQELEAAIAQDQLRLLFQPQVHTATGRVWGVEALVRWQHPDHGVIAPIDFIPLAEESGLIGAIGAWVLREACHQRALWGAQLASPADLTVAVNVSTEQFDSGLPHLVSEVLDENGLPPESLCIELTESTVVGDVESAVRTMQGLRDIGVHVSIDDFGTGYSSLSQLKTLPFDELKVDQAFVHGLSEPGPDRAIVRAIVEVGRALNLIVVAEGVETREQLAQLHELGCDLAQGYLFSTAVDAQAIGALLAGDSLIKLR